jgi:uncharacterized protein YfaS (alpha-2-macroglobulin family)
MHFRFRVSVGFVTAAFVLSLGVLMMADEPADPASQLSAGEKLFADGHFADAYVIFRKIVENPKSPTTTAASAVDLGFTCLQQLTRIGEEEPFIESAAAMHPDSVEVIQSVVRAYALMTNWGTLIDGKFHRGKNVENGKYVTSANRDRVRGMQLLRQAIAAAEKRGDAGKRELGKSWLSLGQQLLSPAWRESWRLTALTDLENLPDYDESRNRWGYDRSSGRGAPVDADGNPVFHSVPATWDAAKNDGERVRFCFTMAMEADSSTANEADATWAGFMYQEFRVATLASAGWAPMADTPDSELDAAAGVFAVDQLSDNETIARLATGIKRFKLPDEHNFFVTWRRIIARGRSSQAESAAETLAGELTDRRQYPRAADQWKQIIAEFGPGQRNHRQNALDQIIKPWVRFESVETQPAGKGAVLTLRSRNASQVTFRAFPINVNKFITDAKAYVNSRPKNINWTRSRIDSWSIANRLMEKRESEYLLPPTAEWSATIQPRPEHRDSLTSVATPLSAPGAYLVTAQTPGGNVGRILVWVADTILVEKAIGESNLYYVADAVTGQPIPKANIEFFGWQNEWDNERNVWKIETRNFAEFTDDDGLLRLERDRIPNGFQWFMVARADGPNMSRRIATLGNSTSWYYGVQTRPDSSVTFAITDRPVYRPEQLVKFHLWIGRSSYDHEGHSPFAGKSFLVRINAPDGTTVNEQTLVADNYGGIHGEYPLPKDARLGQYYINVVDHGGGGFRVEEYKKPEFEVGVDAPKEPVQLGEKISVKVTAKYLFGSPVSQGRVKYKVLRSPHSDRWYPYSRWDWLYGSGAWWFGSDAVWHPGWSKWGCFRPRGWWFPYSSPPPEVVAENEQDLAADGTVAIEIDTAPAKALHGDEDHAYTITAEVVDASRRTIVGSGRVLVARQPFRVFSWLDRGHYNVGDKVTAKFRAQTLDGKPVAGDGKFVLYRVRFNENNEPVESVSAAATLAPNESGEVTHEFGPPEPGQYRASYTLTDAKGRSIEGATLFVVRGPGFDGSDLQFNDLELVTDKREYAPGDTVQLLVNVNRAASAVLLVTRSNEPADRIAVKLLRLTGKSAMEQIAITKADMPNFFVEAVTVSRAKVHHETREILVPPESRVVDVSLTASQTEYKPGESARVQIRVTDAAGKPFVGSTVLTMYDKAVEYISGGSNVGDIRAAFWSWRRSFFNVMQHSAAWGSGNLLRPNEVPMNDLGVFGHDVVNEEFERLSTSRGNRAAMERGFNRKADAMMLGRGAAGLGGFGGGFPGAPALADADAAPMSNAPGSVESFKKDAAGLPLGDEFAGGVEPEPQFAAAAVRRNFADTAVWVTGIETNSDGLAEVSLNMPENLTGWKIRSWTLGAGTAVGQAEAEVVTRKNLLVRLQAPRFFVQKDLVTLSANIHNYLKTDKVVRATIELDGDTLVVDGDATRSVTIPAGGEKRVDWTVNVVRDGAATVRMIGQSDEESDAMQMEFPVYVHGAFRQESYSGVLRPEVESQSVTIRVPEARREDDTRLEVRFSPSLAGAMVDALPYLVDYPHGCTEQTLNRFLPTVVTQRILKSMNVDLAAIREKTVNLNAQEIGDPARRAERWKRFDRNPVFDEAEVAKMVRTGVERLTAMQVSDGGWGWFSGYGEQSYPHTTAVVVRGFQVAEANGVAIVPDVMSRGLDWLQRHESEQVQLLKNDPKTAKNWKGNADDTDALVAMVLADAGRGSQEMVDFLYRDRVSLSVYAKSMLGLVLHKRQQADRLEMVMRNISQFVQTDPENQTAWIQSAANTWWYWYGSDIEANSHYLKLLCKVDPKGERASQLVKYLLNNRKNATYWNSTRDTALAIEALAEFYVASGESRPDMTLEVWFDGRKEREVRITADNIFNFDNSFTLFGKAVTSGEHQLEFRRKGVGPVYFNAYISNFTLEDDIKAAGLEIRVERKFNRLTPEKAESDVATSTGQAVKQRVEKYTRTPLENLSRVTSGDLVEVELIIDSKNDYEYLLFEDMKAAGFEPVDVRSGYGGNGMGAYMELRDERVCFYVRMLSRGRHGLTYRLRAEIPGTFSALPTQASAMYSPELRGNSDETRFQVIDRTDVGGG